MEVKYLSFKEAVQEAAIQNMERDVLVGCDTADEIADMIDIYIEEAGYLLTNTGENYLPDFEQHPHIKVKDWRPR